MHLARANKNNHTVHIPYSNIYVFLSLQHNKDRGTIFSSTTKTIVFGWTISSTLQTRHLCGQSKSKLGHTYIYIILCVCVYNRWFGNIIGKLDYASISRPDRIKQISQTREKLRTEEMRHSGCRIFRRYRLGKFLPTHFADLSLLSKKRRRRDFLPLSTPCNLINPDKHLPLSRNAGRLRAKREVHVAYSSFMKDPLPTCISSGMTL